MKTRDLIILLIIASNFIYAQKSDFTGTWQVHDTLIAAGMGDTYRFYNDDVFIFDFGEFNYNAYFSSVMGKYKIVDKYIVFETKETSEYSGCEISFGGDADYNSWCTTGGKLITKKLAATKSDTVTVQLSPDKKVLTIAGLAFYKISNDPNAERDDYRIPKYFTKPKK